MDLLFGAAQWDPSAPEIPVETHAYQRSCREALCAQLSADAYGEQPLLKDGFKRFTVPDAGSGRKAVLSVFGYVENGIGYLSFRGTVRGIVRNWLSDFHVVPTGRPRRHRGFDNCWKRLRPQIRAWLATQKPRELILTGHSLGGAIAQLSAMELAGEWPIRAVVVFGAPFLGWRAFAAAYDATPIPGRPGTTLGAVTAIYVFKSDLVRFGLSAAGLRPNGEQIVIDEHGRASSAFHPWYADAPNAGFVPLAWLNSVYEAAAGNTPPAYAPYSANMRAGIPGLSGPSASPFDLNQDGRVDWRDLVIAARPVTQAFLPAVMHWIAMAFAAVAAFCALITSYLSVRFIGRDLGYHSMSDRYAQAMAERVNRWIPLAYEERGNQLLAAKDPKGSLAYFDAALAGYRREGLAVGFSGSALLQYASQPRLSRSAALIAAGDYGRAIADLNALIDSYAPTPLEMPVTASASFALTPRVLALQQRAIAFERNGQFREAMEDHAMLLTVRLGMTSFDEFSGLRETARRNAGAGGKVRGLLNLAGYRKREVDRESDRLYELSLRPARDALAKLSEWAHYRRALCAFSLKDFPAAALEATAALQLNERDAWAYHLRGLAHSKAKRAGEALADLDRSIDLEPDIAGFWFARAIARLSTGSKMENDNGQFFLNLSIKSGDLQSVESDLVKALELDPSLPHAKEWLDNVREGRRSAGVTPS